MFLFYVLSFFKKGDTIQGETLFKGGHDLRKYGMYLTLSFFETGAMAIPTKSQNPTIFGSRDPDSTQLSHYLDSTQLSHPSKFCH